MKRICILCTDADVDKARDASKGIIEMAASPILPAGAARHLSIPVSPTGNKPATHWFCHLNCTEEVFERIRSAAVYSTVEESGPKDFLERNGLQLVR